MSNQASIFRYGLWFAERRHTLSALSREKKKKNCRLHIVVAPSNRSRRKRRHLTILFPSVPWSPRARCRCARRSQVHVSGSNRTGQRSPIWPSEFGSCATGLRKLCRESFTTCLPSLLLTYVHTDCDHVSITGSVHVACVAKGESEKMSG